MDKLIIGLTGLIGSGKSIVAQILQENDAFIIDTDMIAHNLTTNNYNVINQITQIFGNNILSTNGLIDRVKLRKQIFQDKAYRVKLENILHPQIMQDVQKTLQKTSAKYIIIVVPLLFKTKNYLPLINRSLFIDCPQEILIERVMQRNNMTKTEVLQILSTQVDRDLQLQLATDIIVNDDGINELRNKITQLHNKYCQILGDIG